MKTGYQKTIYACFLGYIVQAIVNNFVPLLFLTFQSTYDIPLAKITMLVTMNFGIQLIVDLFSAKFVDRIGYRVSILAAHICAAAGLIFLTILPPDLKTCKAYISVLGDSEAQKATLAGLKSAEGYIRRELAHTVNLRNTPEIRFILDQSIEYGVHMSKIIDEVTAKDEENV